MMSIAQLLFGLTLSFLFAAGGNAARVTMKNNCPMTIWPATLTGDQKPQLSTTGFELRPGATSAPIALPALWSGRFWARTGCGAADASGRFSCATGDCGSGQVACDGRGGAPPATLAEIFVAAGGGQDFYDVSNVDGFNLPVSVAPSGGRGECKPSSCPADIDAACPNELAVRGSGGRVIACKSACMAFGRPEFCCTGEFNSPDKCVPTQYSIFFENQCPQAYSYAYDDRSSTFTCFGGPDYVITFCP